MNRHIFVCPILACLTLNGCGGPTPSPVVDMEGVDPVTYKHDLAECIKNQPVFAFGNPVTKCMRDKGYKVLVSY